MKILIVCASNICRSPYVEYMMKRAVESDPELQARVEWVRSSAVLNKMSKLHPMARTALIKEGFTEAEADAHNPSYIWFDYKRFREADVIVGMSRAMKILVPFWLRRKYVTLSEAAGEPYATVPDPYLEKTQEGYDKVMEQIKGYISKYLERIKEGKG